MQSKQKSAVLFDGNRSTVATVLLLAWPIFLEQILTTLVGYADTAMVGTLGATATAAVSISNSVIMLVNGSIMAMGVGITALVSRSIGSNDLDISKKLVRHTVLLLLYIGLPIGIILGLLSHMIPLWMGAEPDVLEAATQYNIITAFGRPFQIASMLFCSVYRGCGDTKTPLWINSGVNILNVIGNFFLIYPTRPVNILGLSFYMPGAGWGINGAAAATAFSMAVGGVIAVALVFCRESPFRISLKQSYRVDWRLTRQIFRISFPAIMERLCMSGAQIVITASIASLGTITVAANTVYLTAESIAYMPGFAFATAVTTLVGQALGAGKPKLAEKYAYTCLLSSILVMVVAGAGLFFFAGPLVSIFTPDQQVIALASQCLCIVAFLEPPQSGAQVLAGALRGAGDTVWPMIITIAGMWGIRAIGAVICIRFLGMGLPAACTCMLIESFVRLVLFWLRFRTGKWKHAIQRIETSDTKEEETPWAEA
ncbi:MAG: MATE family efflux transporter [Hydrogeniiclostridium sp.]